MKKSQISGLVVGAVVVLGYFLPWARLAPESLFRNVGSLVNRLSDERSNWARDYVWMRGREWEDMWREPAEGVSGYQLFMMADEDGENRLVRAWMAMLFGSKEAGWQVRLMILGPLLGVGGILAVFFKKPKKWFLWGVAVGCVLFYGLVRMKLAESFSDRLLLHVEISYGLWLMLYGLLVQGVLVAVKAVLPARSKW